MNSKLPCWYKCTYDANGNLTADTYKGISSITYNHLNLPSVITYSNGNSIEIIYDANGGKLRKIVKVGATLQYEQDYLGGLEYRKVGTNAKRLEAVYHDEGRFYNLNVEVNNTLSIRYEYSLRDHLGNTRLTFTDKNANGIVDITNTPSTSDILQENQYYPFGMAYEGPWLMNDAARDTKYQYNGKEVSDDFGLNWMDYGARWYDASIGRWNAIDPLSENNVNLSTYSFTANNPILFIDPDGRDWFRHDSTGAIIWLNFRHRSMIVGGQTYQNVGRRYAWTMNLADGTAATVIGNRDGSTNLLLPNEYGMVRFPESGHGFTRYSNNVNDVYQYEKNGVLGAHGDNWASPQTAAAFYNTIQQFYKEQGVTVFYGDISAYRPGYDLAHNTHFTGNSIDIHYWDGNGAEVVSTKAYKSGDVCLVNCFMSIAESNGFTNNYTYGNRFTHSGNNNQRKHKDHLHIGRPDAVEPRRR